MDFIFETLRTIFFTKIIGDIDLYTILSSLFKYIFVFIVLYFIYLIVKLIFLDIKTVYSDSKFKKSYLKLVDKEDREDVDDNIDKKIPEHIELNQFTSIGRDFDNDLILDDTLVSRRHAIIIWKNDGFYLEDMKSSNGTFLNGEKISEPEKLENLDIITFGIYQYSFNRGEEENV